MRSRLFRSAALVAVALVASCTDKSPTGASPNKADGSPNSSVPLGSCTTLANLKSLIQAVFPVASPNIATILAKLDNLQTLLQAGNVVPAQAAARDIVSFVQQKAESGELNGVVAQIQTLISSVLCYVGLPTDTFLVAPTDAPRVLLTSDKKAGVSLQGNSVNQLTLITIAVLPTDAAPLNTKLDVYPGYVLVTQSGALTKPAVVGVCPSATVPASVLPRLRLGHQKSTGFEITPNADASFLDCSNASASTVPGWLRAVASLVMPKPLYAKVLSGGVGGLATEFSPFGPVDTELRFSGGVGGTATEFQGAPAIPQINAATAATCGTAQAQIGGPVEAECRPGVVMKTAKGTVLQNVPIGWAIALGGGVVAPEASTSRVCGAFLAAVTTTTDATGRAGVCWNLGAAPGVNTTVATPSVGGDAPAGVSFSPASITFSATALPITPTATATGGTFNYDAQAHPGTGTCSNGLVPALSYGGSAAPVNVGVYSLTVTCGAGNPAYKTSTQSASIEIKPAITTASVTCPASLPFNGAAQTPCSGIVTAPGLSVVLAPAYTANGDVGTATASVSYAGDANHLASTASSTFKITPAPTLTTVTCPVTAAFTGSPITPCTAVATGPGLSEGLGPVYSSNVATGTATATASYAGGGNYLASSGSATFQISGIPSSASVNCPAFVFYTGSPVTPCTGTVSGPGLSLTVTPTYSSNVVGTATATVNYAGGGNNLPAIASKTFQIYYVQTGVFTSLSGIIPSTQAFVTKGTNVFVAAHLSAVGGSGVTGASGELSVLDLGPNGFASPVTVLTQPNAFTAGSPGNYTFSLSTNGLSSGHFYFVTAAWNDGSHTGGWFYLK